MRARASSMLIAAVLAVSGAAARAEPQAAAAVTVLGPHRAEIGEPAVLVCASDACRGTLPLDVAGRQCQLNVHIAYPRPGDRSALAIFSVARCTPPLASLVVTHAELLRLGDAETVSRTVLLTPDGGTMALRDLLWRAALGTVRVDFAIRPQR